jgi:regulator of sigma E protease
LERDLKVHLSVNGELVTYLIDPKAVVVSKDRETQIAPWDRQFGSKTVGQRALSIFAGPMMNFLLAFVLFLLFMLLNGVSTNVKLDNVEANSPAFQAGLQAGDLIKEVNYQPIGTDVNKLTTLIKDSQNKPMNWVISRKGEQIQKTVTPVNNLVGIRLTWEKRDATVIEAVSGAWDQLLFSAKQILVGFKMLLFGQFKMEDLGGPVRIVEVSGQFAQAGLAYMISWSGLLSLYLGLFNLLPIPALDGSRLVFLGIEAIRGKPVDPNRESMVHFIGFAMLMLLMVAVTYNDILRLING